MKKLIFLGCCIFLFVFVSAQVRQVRKIKPVESQTTSVTSQGQQMVIPVNLKSAAFSTIKLKNGSTLKYEYTTLDDQSAGSMTRVSPKVASESGISIMHADKFNGSISVSPKYTASNNEQPNGQYCVSGTQELSLSNVDLLPVGTKEFQYRFLPGEVFDLSINEPASFYPVEDGRKAVTIYASNTSNTANVDVATNSNLSKAINSLIISMPENSSGNIVASLEEVKTEQEFNVKVTGGAKCIYGSVSGMFDFSKANNSYKFLFNFGEESYTISADKPQNGYFTNAALENNNSLGYIKTVTYGRRCIISIETSKYSSDQKSELEAKFNYLMYSANIKMTQSQKKLFEDCKVRCLIIGGDSKAAYAFPLTSPAELRNAIKTYLENYTNSKAVPIKVNMTDLKGKPIYSILPAQKIPYNRCFDPIINLEVSLASITVNTTPGVRPSYRMWGGFSLNGYNQNGEIPDFYKRPARIDVTDKSSHFIDIKNGATYKADANMKRLFQMNNIEPQSRIVFAADLADNGDISDSYQRGKNEIYINEIMEKIAASEDGNAKFSFNVNDGSFYLTITYQVREVKINQ